MSVHNRNIKEAAKSLSGTFGVDTAELVYCTVDSIDIPNCTCSCTPISGKATTGIENVLLKAEANDGFMLVPSVKSTVVVGISSLTKIPFVMLFEDIDQVIVKINNTQFNISDGLTKFNDGSNGGIPNVVALVSKVNALENLLNNVLNVLKATSIPLAPSGTYPFAPLYAALNDISPITARADIEDTTVTH